MLPWLLLTASLVGTHAPEPSQSFALGADGVGYHICPLNDVDGDGGRDFVLDEQRGWVWLVSGRTGRVLKRVRGTDDQHRLGGIAPLFADVDGDGAWDLVGERETTGKNMDVEIWSGRSLEPIRALAMNKDEGTRTGNVVCVGDWDSDGTPDLAIVCVRETRVEGAARVVKKRSVRIVSGKSGEELQVLDQNSEWAGLASPSEFAEHLFAATPGAGRRSALAASSGEYSVVWVRQADVPAWFLLADPKLHLFRDQSLGFVGDVDGDGISDIAHLVRLHEITKDLQIQSYGASVVSGKDGSKLWSLEPGRVEVIDGIAATELGDLNGDGHLDFMVAFQGFVSGSVIVYSGTDGSLIRTHPEDRINCPDACRLGVSLANLGRVDDDEVDDYAIGSSGGIDGGYPGCVSVHSGATGKRLYVLWKKDLIAQ